MVQEAPFSTGSSDLTHDCSLSHFLDRLSSGEPAPGGGSASALAGAVAASLVCMVCRLTLGRAKFAAVSARLQATLEQAEILQARLTAAIDADAQAYEAVVSAYALPRADEVQRAARTQALQAALKQATCVPLAVARDCARVLEMARFVSEAGNPNAASDAAASRYLALAGLRGALGNVAINLPLITDAGFVAEAQSQTVRLEACAAQALD